MAVHDEESKALHNLTAEYIEGYQFGIFQKERNKHRCMESEGAYSLPRDGRRFQRARNNH